MFYFLVNRLSFNVGKEAHVFRLPRSPLPLMDTVRTALGLRSRVQDSEANTEARGASRATGADEASHTLLNQTFQRDESESFNDLSSAVIQKEKQIQMK